MKDITNNKHFNKPVDYKMIQQHTQNYRDNGYCSVIACSLMLGVKFGKARSIMAKCGREAGQGDRAVNYGDTDMYSEALWQALAYHNKIVQCYPECASGTLRTITRKLPAKGKFLIYVARHVVAVVDGQIQDWTAEHGLGKKVLSVWEVK